MNEYDEIDDLALTLRMDYGFLDKRVDVFELIKKLGVRTVKYSQLNPSQRDIIENQCSVRDAMTIFDNKKSPFSCFLLYNDDQNHSRIRFSIAHEIKHILCDERNPTDKEEKLADHFARALLAPSCLLVRGDYESPIAVASDFDIFLESAGHALNLATRRRKSSTFKLSKLEKEFLRLYEDEHKTK